MVQSEELLCLARRVRNSLPNVETHSLATIYRAIKDHEKTSLNLTEFKEFIYHLTSWDISFEIIRCQLEINQIQM
jgi:hypothetical protein